MADSGGAAVDGVTLDLCGPEIEENLPALPLLKPEEADETRSAF
jgi:hypothetical protein